VEPVTAPRHRIGRAGSAGEARGVGQRGGGHQCGEQRGGREADAHIPGTVEHVVVTAGRITAGPVEAYVELGPGDYASFPGDVPHAYQALHTGSAAVLVMEHV
jgi:quercetin dioxygenase-like cupin family protein